jgi:type II secretory pathway component PulF
VNPRDEQLEVTARVAEMAATGLPLEPALRALAEEVPSARVRRGLLAVCQRLERGEPLDRVVAQPDSRLPLHVAGLLSAGLRTGRLSELLAQYLEHARRWQDVRRQTLAALLYPAVLLAAALAVLSLYLLWLMPGMREMLADFDTRIPSITIFVIAFSDFVREHLPWVLLAIAAVLFGAPALIAAIAGRHVWHRLIHSIPLLGPMLRYSAFAEFCHLLSLLVRYHVPLPDALRMAAAASRDADLALNVNALARFAESGERLELAPLDQVRLPFALRAPFHWEGHIDAFPDSLEAAGAAFASLAAVRASLLRTITMPIILVAISIAVAALVVTSFAPLVTLLNDLA